MSRLAHAGLPRPVRRALVALTVAGLAAALILVGAVVVSARSHQEANGGWEKVDANPVLGGGLGVVFDVSVLDEGGAFRMWLSWRTRGSIALAESADGLSWGEPIEVLGPREATGWEETVNRPVVIRRPDGYHMWYTGQTAESSAIGHAVSDDGLLWTRTSEQPVLRPDQPWEHVAVMAPHVLWDEDEQLYKMWYSGGEQFEPDAIGYAVSVDGLSWTKSAEPVFLPSPGEGWDGHKVTAAQVLVHDGWYVMFYIGFRDLAHAQIGIARSRDGVSGWERHPANPIVRPGFSLLHPRIYGEWDADAVYKPYAVLRDDRWYLWYNGRRRHTEQIGLAIHEGANLGFDE